MSADKKRGDRRRLWLLQRAAQMDEHARTHGDDPTIHGGGRLHCEGGIGLSRDLLRLRDMGLISIRRIDYVTRRESRFFITVAGRVAMASLQNRGVQPLAPPPSYGGIMQALQRPSLRLWR